MSDREGERERERESETELVLEINPKKHRGKTLSITLACPLVFDFDQTLR